MQNKNNLFAERLLALLQEPDIDRRIKDAPDCPDKDTLMQYATGQISHLPSLAELHAIARVFFVTPNYLLGFDDYRNGKDADSIYLESVIQYCEECTELFRHMMDTAMANINDDNINIQMNLFQYAESNIRIYRHLIPDMMSELAKDIFPNQEFHQRMKQCAANQAHKHKNHDS